MKIFALNNSFAKPYSANAAKSSKAPMYINSNTDLNLLPNYKVSFTSQSRRVMLPQLIVPLTEKEALQEGYTLVYDKEGLQKALNDNKKTILMSDIDLGKATQETISFGNWTSIDKFSNELNGNGYKIKNLKNGLDKWHTYQKGLFEQLDNAVIKNLIIEDAYLISNNEYDVEGFGILANECSAAKIKNCAVSGKLLTKNNRTGGVIGNSKDTVFDSVRVNAVIKTIPSTYTIDHINNKFVPIEDTSVPHTAQRVNSIGTLAGHLEKCYVTNCLIDSKIKGWISVGGIAGSAKDSYFSSCKIKAELSGVRAVGGAAGLINNCTCKNCSGEVHVKARIPKTSHYLGGVAGLVNNECLNYEETENLISNCEFFGSVSSPGREWVIGRGCDGYKDNRIVGGAYGASTVITNSTAENIKVIKD